MIVDSADDKELMKYLLSCSIPEDDLLRDLLATSISFKKFYDMERMKIQSPLIWLHNKKLRKFDQIPEGRLAEIRTLPNGHISIIIRNNPAKITDATTIAHELAHGIDGDEGFPLIGHYPGCGDPQIIAVARMLNEMIHDPLVIRRLLQYGFDLQKEYQYECIGALKKLKKSGTYTGIRLIMVTSLYVQNLLENDLLFSDADNPCKKYIERIEELHPECKIKGDEIYAFIRSNGFYSPDQVKRIYKKIYETFPELNDLTVMYE